MLGLPETNNSLPIMSFMNHTKHRLSDYMVGKMNAKKPPSQRSNRWLLPRGGLPNFADKGQQNDQGTGWCGLAVSEFERQVAITLN